MNETPADRETESTPGSAGGGEARHGGRTFRQRMTHGAIWTVLGRIMSAGSLFLSLFFLARLLPKPDFAAFSYALSTVFLLTTLASLGTPSILTRTLRHVIFGGVDQPTSQILVAFGKVSMLGALAVSVGFVAVSKWVPLGTNARVVTEYPLLVSAWFSLMSLGMVMAWALQGLDDFRSGVVVGARSGGALTGMGFLAYVAICFVTSRVPDLRDLLVVQVIFSAISLLVGFYLIVWRMRELGLLHREAHVAQGAAVQPGTRMSWILWESLTNLGSALIGVAMIELDVLWVGSMASDVQLADYAAAKNVVKLVSSPFVMLLPSLAPFVTELVAQGQLQRLERICRGFTSLVAWPVALLFGLCMVFPSTIIGLYGEGYEDAGVLLMILSIGNIVFVLTGNKTQVLVMGGYQGTALAYSALTFLLYLVIARPLMASYEAVGAAAALSAVLAVQNIILMISAKRCVGVWTLAGFSPASLRVTVQMFLGPGRRGPKPQDSGDPSS